MPIDHIIIHDTRLRGTVAARENMRLITTHCESLSSLSDRVNAAFTQREPAMQPASGSGPRLPPAPVMSILAHGATVTSGPIDWAMQLGMEYVTRTNAREFGRSIRGCVSERIRVLCCNAAGSEDGRATMRELAQGAGVQVFASTTRQQYSRVVGEGTNILSRNQVDGQHGGWINFGRWEGTVMRFPPSSRSSSSSM